MTVLTIKDFRGEIPRRESELLPEGYADVAINTKLLSGSLKPFFEEQFLQTQTRVGTVLSLFQWGGGIFFTWTTDVNAAFGPVPGDTLLRTYYTGDGFPKMTYFPLATAGGPPYPSGFLRLGVPAPVTAPTLSVSTPTGAISGFSNADPAVVTATAHGLESGTYITITGLVAPTNPNHKHFVIYVLDANHFSLATAADGVPYDSTALAAYGGGGTWAVDPSVTPATAFTSRAYAYTFVSALGEEGSPSPPSVVIAIAPGQQVTVNGMDTSTAVTGPFDLATKNVYRTQTSATGTQFQFAGTVSLATTSFVDTLTSDQLGEVLPSILNDMPPADMQGMLALPNGVMAGFSKNRLCVSLPGLPHAWPALYQKTVNSPIVAISNFGNSIVVATQQDAYLADGTDPQTISLEKLQVQQGCTSKRSMVSLGLFGVAFSVPNGIVLVNSAGPQLLTRDWIDKDTWATFNPSSILGLYHDSMYFGFYDATSLGGVRGGFIFDPRRGSIGYTYDPSLSGIGFVMTDSFPTAGYAEPLLDLLYLQVGSSIVVWDSTLSNTTMTYQWRSQKFDTREEINMAYAEVLARDYNSLTFKLYADIAGTQPTLQYTKAVTNRFPFALPSLELSENFQIEFTGHSEVIIVRLAETMEELRRVSA